MANTILNENGSWLWPKIQVRLPKEMYVPNALSISRTKEKNK